MVPTGPDFPLTAAELSRWTRFGVKGGIGRAEALTDKLAEGAEELMFLQGDEIVVLLALEGGSYLGFCEGIVGRFATVDVTFKTKLKRTVMAPRVQGTQVRRSPTSPPRSSSDGNDGHTLKVVDERAVRREVEKVEKAVSRVEEKDQAGEDGRSTPRKGGGGSGQGNRSDEPRTPQASAQQFSEMRESPTRTSSATPTLMAYPSTSTDVHGDSPATPTAPTWDRPLASASARRRSPPRTPEVESRDATASLRPTTTPIHPPRDTSPSSRSNLPPIQTEFSTYRSPINYTLAPATSTPRSGSKDLHSAFSSTSSTSAHTLSATLDSQPGRVRSGETAWSQLTNEDGLGQSPGTGFETEMSIFDSYRYSQSQRSSVASTAIVDIEPPNKYASMQWGKGGGGTTLDQLDEQEGEDDDTVSFPAQREVVNVASTLRGKLEAGISLQDAPRTRNPPPIPNSFSTESLQGIPRLADLFPRSSTIDSFASLASIESSTTGSPQTRAPTSFDELLALRRLNQTTTIPIASAPRCIVELPESPAPSPDRAGRFLPRKASVKGLKIGSPVSIPPEAQPAWSAVSFDPRAYESFNVTQSPPVINLATPTPQTQRSLGEWNEEVHSPASFDSRFSRRSPSTVASTYQYNASSPSSSPSNTSFASPEIHRARSFGSLRDGASKLRKASLPDDMVFASKPPPMPTSESLDFFENENIRSPGGSTAQKPSLFSFGRKSKIEKSKYGAPVSSKDYEEETVKLGKAQFEIIKPSARVLNYEPDSRAPYAGPLPPRPPYEYSERRSEDVDTDRSSHSSNVGQYGFSQSMVSLRSYSQPASPALDDRSVESYRASELKWVQTLATLSVPAAKKSKKLASLVQAGIPSSVRGTVWAYLTEGAELDKVEGLYYNLCSLEPLPVYDRIDQDIAETYANDVEFVPGSVERDDLTSVLRALAQYDRNLGFGRMARVAGILLSHATAEESFWIFVAMINRYDLRNSFEGGRENLQVETLAFDYLLESTDSKLAKRFNELGVNAAGFLPSWTSTLFAHILPYSTTLRVIDLYFFDRTYITRVALAILDLLRPRVMDTGLFPTQASLLSFLLNIPPSALPSSILLTTICAVKLSSDRIRKATKQAELAISQAKRSR